MARVIDTSVCIAMERRGRFVDDLTSLSAGEPIAIAAITVAELLTGAESARTSALRHRARLLTEHLLEHVPTLPFDIEAARIYARLNAELRTAGLRIGGFDLQIASTAIAHRSSVVTLNLREFRRIPDLTVTTPDW